MDDARIPAQPAGGSVEPLRKETAANQAPPRQPSQMERFELRDPFAEVTHRSHSFDNMSSKADRLGAIRFVAIDPDGNRSTVSKVAGAWQRPERTQPIPVVQLPGASSGQPTRPSLSSHTTPEPTSAKALDTERASRVIALETTLNERYLIRRAPIRIGDVTIGQTEYRHRGDTSRIAFTESGSRLSTDTNSPSVARSMVDVAEARNWQALRVSGNDDFRRMVWLEASLRNVRAVGYEPVPADQDLLRKEREARHTNRIEPLPAAGSGAPIGTKQSTRGGGRKTVLATLEAVLVAQKVPERQREAVMAAAATNLAQRVRSGETPRVKVFDRSSPVQRPAAVPTRPMPRDHDRAGPTR